MMPQAIKQSLLALADESRWYFEAQDPWTRS